MARVRTLVLLPFLALACVACGGGGGGGGDAPADPGAPGTLRALALEGESAPGSGGGAFDVFPTFPAMSAGNGGWCAFVAPTTGGTSDQVLYVALPDASASLVPVFAQGDGVPAAGRFIRSFPGVWMLEDGTVLALVTLDGGMGSAGYALLGADVDNAGMVSNIRTLLVEGDSLAPAISGGILGLLDPDTLRVELDGTLWMLIDDTVGGETHLVSMEDDGTGLRARVATGEFADSSMTDTVASIDAFGIDALGGFYAWAITDSNGARRVNLRETVAGPTINTQILRDGDPMPSGVGTVAQAYKRGRLYVYGDASVVWSGKGSVSGADDVLFLYMHNNGPLWLELARVTETAPDTGMGTFNSIDTLNAAPSARRTLFAAGVTGGTLGITQATFRLDNIAPLTVRGDTANIVLSGGAIEPANYINLRQTTRPYDEVSFDGGMIYANTWLSTSAVWWVTRNGPLNRTNAIAAQGGPAPGGDTFGSFNGGVGMTTANGVVLFRAPVTNAGTGIFRQGP